MVFNFISKLFKTSVIFLRENFLLYMHSPLPPESIYFLLLSLLQLFSSFAALQFKLCPLLGWLVGRYVYACIQIKREKAGGEKRKT